MTRDLESYRDDLGIAWHAIDPVRDLSLSHLETRLRRQTPLIDLAALGCGLVGVGGAALGTFTLWQGWSLGAANFGVRGFGLLAVAALALFAARTLRRVKGSTGGKGLAGLVDLELTRALGAIGLVRLGLAACAAALVCGLAGAAIRYAVGDPPALSPLADVALLSGGALALLGAGFLARARVLMVADLRRVLRRG
jgi:hypothetical protein